MKAIFLDRDGTINDLILNPQTQEYESPHSLADIYIPSQAMEALKLLNTYKLFIISNQPSFAKGKVDLLTIQEIAKEIKFQLTQQGIQIAKDYYCYHHPQSIVPELRISCPCRKPGTFFVEEAIREFSLDPRKSWFIGDRDSDMECGKKMGCNTILLSNPLSISKQGKSQPDFVAKDLLDATRYIMAKCP